MDDEITLSKDYLAAFKHQKKIGNADQMYELAIGLLSEIGIQDEKSAGESIGKQAAAIRNHTSDTGVTAKKL
jgi:hypothetical protein